jgi:hypothetical protein
MTFEESMLRLSLPHYVNGWLTDEEARLLWDTAAATDGPILEVGTYHGRSTILLAGLGRPIHSVDPFTGFDDTDPTGDKTLAKLRENLAARGIQGVSQYRVRIEEWAPRPCGFAYLDGDHTYQGTLAQIEAARKCGVKTMCLHDYEDNGGGKEIVRAVKQAGLNVVEVAGRLAACRSE